MNGQTDRERARERGGKEREIVGELGIEREWKRERERVKEGETERERHVERMRELDSERQHERDGE